MEGKTLRKRCQCHCGIGDFRLRLKKDEQIGLVTCIDGHHSLLLDSRDYWADVTQGRKPRLTRCACTNDVFHLDMLYEFRETGDVRCIDVLIECSKCGVEKSQILAEIKYAPTDELVSSPLDSIEEPWFHAKRNQITAYWQPMDAEAFADYLVIELGAWVFVQNNDNELVPFVRETTWFSPTLHRDLYFSNFPDLVVSTAREPYKVIPVLRLSSASHILLSLSPGLDDVVLLHYVEYSDQVIEGGVLKQQPETFLDFTRAAHTWLKEHYISTRGKNTADNPMEFLRMRHLLHSRSQ